MEEKNSKKPACVLSKPVAEPHKTLARGELSGKVMGWNQAMEMTQDCLLRTQP
jgi:hypothetical protein